MSIPALARASNYARQYAWEIATGKKPPTVKAAHAFDRALDAGGQLADCIGREEGEMDRRTVLRAVAAAGAVVTGLPVNLTSDVPRRIGTGHVDDVVDATAAYRGMVRRHGGAGVRQPAAALLQRACELHAAATGKVRQSLLGAVADLAGLGAYIARDVGDHAGADEHARLALSAAAAAGNTGLAGHTVVRMAGHCIELRQPDRVLAYLGAACDRARQAFAPGDRANQACIKAWAHALTGDVEAVRRAVGNAETEFGRVDHGGQVAGWAAQHVAEAELWSLTGAAYTELARRDPSWAGEAVERLTRAIDLRAVPGRNRALDQVSLAEAMLCAGEVDEAGRVALTASAGGDGIESGRLTIRLSELAGQLRPHQARSEQVAAFVAAR